jgi:hypothetical protein
MTVQQYSACNASRLPAAVSLYELVCNVLLISCVYSLLLHVYSLVVTTFNVQSGVADMLGMHCHSQCLLRMHGASVHCTVNCGTVLSRRAMQRILWVL